MPNRTTGKIPYNIRGERPATYSRSRSRHRPTTPELTDWWKDKLRNLSVKEIAALAECSERTAENYKLGKCAPNSASMTTIFINSSELGALYMEHIGLLLPGQAETAAAYTRFANAAVRAKS